MEQESVVVYTLPEDYVRRCRYTAFLNRHRGGRHMLGWYIGPESGRLFGVYISPTDEYPETDGYNIKNDGALHFWETVPFDDWDLLNRRIRQSPEVHVTENMAYFMGLGTAPPCRQEAKILPFPLPHGQT